MAARRNNPEATRNAILAAAFEVFVERGVGNAALSDIAKRSGITKSLIHHHFGSKEALWDEVKQIGMRAFFEGQLQIIRSDKAPADALRSAVVAAFEAFRGNQQLARMMGWAQMEANGGTFELKDTVTREGVERIAEGQRKGALREDLDPAYVLSIFVLLAGNWFHFKNIAKMWIQAQSEDELDDTYLDNVLKIFFEGVLPR